MARLSQLLDLNAPRRLAQSITPEAINERVLAAEQAQMGRENIQRERSLREIMKGPQETLPERLAQGGFAEESLKFGAAQEQAAQRRQSAEDRAKAAGAQRNREIMLQLSARGINGDVPDDIIASTLMEFGIPQEQAAPYIQDAQRRRAAGQNLQEFFYSVGDPEGYIKQKSKIPGATGPEIGKYNPGDYTPASFATFLKTKNPADLVGRVSLAYDPELAARIAAAREAGKASGKDMALAPGREEAVGSFAEAKALLDSGIYAGLLADVQKNIDKATGLVGGDTSKAARTEEFMALLATTVLPRMAELGGNDTEEERRYLERMMGGDIRLEPKAIKRIIESAERKIQRRLTRAGENVVNPYPGQTRPALPALPPPRQPTTPRAPAGALTPEEQAELAALRKRFGK